MARRRSRSRGAQIAVVCALIAASAGCGGGDSSSSAPCDDAAFRGQDEELYVVKATVANAIAGGGDRAALLKDLQRGRTALADYLEAHPPCSDALKAIASDEQAAVDAIDDAIASLERGNDAAASLDTARGKLAAAQEALASAS